MNYRTAYKLRKIQALIEDPVLIALWGLILAKCCFLEHFVRLHGVPVNTGIYIWSLSLFMAGVATVVLSGLVEARVQHPNEKPDAPLLWPVVISVMMLLLLGAFSAGGSTALSVLPVLCLPPGIAFALQCGMRLRPVPALQSVAWFVSAGILFVLPLSARLLPLSIILLLLVALPGALYFIRNRREIRQAMHGLKK